MDNSPISTSPVALLEAKIDALTSQLTAFHTDVQFIKAVLQAKIDKKERRRQKRALKQLEAERQQRQLRLRRQYEEVVRTFRWRPWYFMQAPQSRLSPKELELVGLVKQNASIDEITQKMGIKPNSVPPRFCAMRKYLGVDNDAAVIAYFDDYQRVLREHRHRRCITLLRWFLHPPEGRIHEWDFKTKWRRRLGKGNELRYAGPYVPLKAFESLRVYEHRFLRMKLDGNTNSEIAAHLKIKETTLKSYFGRIRSTVWYSAGTNCSNEQLVSFYGSYVRKRKP